VAGTPASELVYKEMKVQSTAVHQTMSSSVARSFARLRGQHSLVNTSPGAERRIACHAALKRSLCQECTKPLLVAKANMPLPRYRVFYNAKYEKAAGLPKTHMLHKVSTCQPLIALVVMRVMLVLQSVQAVDAAVDAAFMASLSLLPWDDALTTHRSLRRLFKRIRVRYRSCAISELLEKYCSLQRLAQLAEPLTEPAAGQDADLSELFATPASKGTMDLLPSAGGSGDKTGTSTTKSGMAGASAGTATLSGSPQGSTWHSNTATTSSGPSSREKIPLTSLRSDSSRVLETTPSHIAAHEPSQAATLTSGASSAQRSTATGGTLVDDGRAEDRENARARPVQKKTRRGTRAGKLVKQRSAPQSAQRSSKGVAAVKSTAPAPRPSTERSLSREIQLKVDRLCQQHFERPLVTVGDKLVNSIVHNASRDAQHGELHTQSPGKNATSSGSVTHPCAPEPAGSVAAGGMVQSAAPPPVPPPESETTYASAPSVVHRDSDRKRKVVSILESFDPDRRRASSAPTSQQLNMLTGLAGTPSGTPQLKSAPTGEFQYYCDTGTPSGAGVNSSLGQGAVNATVPPCPEQLGELVVKDLSRNKKKKVKAKFRTLFKKHLRAQHTPLKAVLHSPVLPDTGDSGLAHHLNRPFLTEVRAPIVARVCTLLSRLFVASLGVYSCTGSQAEI
jgi:hypothetical protein